MLKFFGMLFGFVFFAALAYMLHVPFLKAWSAPIRNPELSAYSSLSDGVEGQTYKIEQIVDGRTLEIFYDPENKVYVLAVEFFENPEDDYFGRHIIILEENGDLREIRQIDQEHLETLFNATNLEQVARIGEREYVPEFSFADSKGLIDLVHYQFQEFEDWPYLYYFIPVIPSDWKGTAYLNVRHEDDVFNIKIPTEYNGGFLYTSRNVDGQIYLRKRPDDAPGLTFLQVGESSYTRDMNGVETHREGYGMYLMRRK